MNRTVVLSVAFALVLAGCVGGGSEEESSGPLPAKFLSGAPDGPAVINATLHPGQVTWYAPWDLRNCGPHERSTSTVKVFDRNGWLRTYELYFDGPRGVAKNITLSLAGEAPWVVAGQTHSCGSIWWQGINGATAGFSARFARGEGKWLEMQIPVHVPVGQQSAEAVWEPGPRVWWLIQMVHRAEDREGERYGEIKVTDANGNLTRIERYHPIDGESFSYDSFMLIDGPYKIRLDLELPALRPTTWTYTIHYMELDEDFCGYDFEWDIC